MDSESTAVLSQFGIAGSESAPTLTLTEDEATQRLLDLAAA
jgi:hypothetical protein